MKAVTIQNKTKQKNKVSYRPEMSKNTHTQKKQNKIKQAGETRNIKRKPKCKI